jgi:hypothetical protein
MSDNSEAGFGPSPDFLRPAKTRFQALDASTFAHLRFAAEPPVELAADVSRAAVVHLPDEQPLAVHVTASREWVRLVFDRHPQGLVPATVTLLTPALREESIIRLGNRATPNLESVKTPSRLAAGSTSQAEAADTPYTLAARATPGKGWQTDWFVGSHGLRAKLEQVKGHDSVAIRCLLPGGERQPVVRYRIAWSDEQGNLKLGDLRAMEIIRAGDGEWQGYALPGAGMEVDKVRQAPGFEVRFACETPLETDWLTAPQFLQTVGEDHQVLVLSPAAGAERPTFEGNFRSDAQRRLWSSPLAWRMVRFQPT